LLNDPDPEIQKTVADCWQNLYPEQAERAGVYEKFPDLRPGSTNVVGTEP
jgi:hypothetical protein